MRINKQFGSAIKLRNYLIPSIIFILTYLIQSSIAYLGLDLHHDLLMFDAARKLYEGNIPYKDFFYQYNLATVLLQAFSLYLFGVKIHSLKLITVIFYSLITVAIYCCCANRGYIRAGIIASILWSFLSPFFFPAMNAYHPWSTVYMMTSCMLGAFFLVALDGERSFFGGVFGGIFFAVAFWFKQVAAIQILATGLWLVILLVIASKNHRDKCANIKRLIGFLFGGVITCIPFFAYLYLNGAIADWWNCVFSFNKNFANDSTRIVEFLKLLNYFFPRNSELGAAYLFAYGPIVLLASILIIVINWKKFAKLDYKLVNLPILFSLLSIAGWVEYFPLPHPFHTHLFMAPLFVLMGILCGSRILFSKEIVGRWILMGMIFIFSLMALKEAWDHALGARTKLAVYQESTIVKKDTVFDGLKILNDQYKSLVNFYENMLLAQGIDRDAELIPMSVDPLRAMLPSPKKVSLDFKMGVNWTWPNEQIEPGFSKRLSNGLFKQRDWVYGDSLIYINGYIPHALLEMPSPITQTHTLYKPIPGQQNLNIYFENNKNILNAKFDILDKFSRLNTVFRDVNDIVLLPLADINLITIKEIKNIHISYLEMNAIPVALNALEKGYLDKYDYANKTSISSFYYKTQSGLFERRKNLSRDNKRDLALFFLSHGKLFNLQNYPRFNSTLSAREIRKPFLAEISRERESVRIIWPPNPLDILINRQNNYAGNLLYLGIKERAILDKNEDLFALIQFELNNNIALSQYYIFLDDR